ncbi:MAG: VPLPA-CTERM sorting domain-containing protein [Marinicaulis sp.]|nr:VPLPA-CTERM sorting domain-containing protein [Marinicaulis sp.]
MQYTFAEAVGLVMMGVALLRFAFNEPGIGVQFYVNSFEADVAPLPAAVPLLLAALAGLGFASRKKKRTTA